MKKEEKRMITAVVIDTTSNKATVETFEDELEEFYRLLNCDLFDIVRRKIGGKYYDIYCDDIGLYADEPIVSAIDPFDSRCGLVGNLIIVNHDAQGYSMSLTDADIIRVYSRIGKYRDDDGSERLALMISY